MFTDVNAFIAELDKREELARITEPVDPNLEIAAVIDRVSKTPGGGPGAAVRAGRRAARCRSPRTSTARCRASAWRSAWSTLDELAHEIEELTTPPMPRGFMDALKMMPLVSRLTDLMPKTVKDAPCQEVVKTDGGLDELPVLTTWPEDGGPFITLPLVITRDPETGMRNIGTYRMQVYDRRTTGMHWQRHKGGAQHHRVAERWASASKSPSRSAPIRCCSTAATAPMPEGPRRADAGRRARQAPRRDGEVPDHRSRSAGAARRSFSRATSSPASGGAKGRSAITRGCIRSPTTFRCSTCTCMTMRKKPVYVTTVVGDPPMEDYYLGMASERIFLPLIRKTLPEIVDMHFPAAGIFHNFVLVSIDKRYPGHARKIMSAFWGLGQLMFSKCIVVVDKDVNVQDEAEVAWIAGTHVDPSRDIQIVTGPVDDLDDAAIMPAFGGKMGIDATRKWPSEGVTREFPTKLVMTEAAASGRMRSGRRSNAADRRPPSRLEESV